MGCDRAYELVVMEDENTGYQTIGPVSKMFNMLCRWHRDGPDSEAFKQHCAKIDDFLWMSDEGLMMTGTNGSQLWDAAFMSQALVETGLGEEKQNREASEGVLDWLDKCQIRENSKWYGKDYRHATKGTWPFSTPEQSYVVRMYNGWLGVETGSDRESYGLIGQRLCGRRVESGDRAAKPKVSWVLGPALCRQEDLV